MGVKDLWSILEPILERKPLDDLNGTVVAVDLSIWVCQLQAAVHNPTVIKPYLRNLFFRISALLRRNIVPVFVTEGEPPEIKQRTIQNRINARCGRTKNVNHKEKCEKVGKRKKFDACLKECTELIEYLGLPHVESDGEAEAFCAALNSAGIVDSVVTDDGDAFLYGAVNVCRNLNLEGKIPSFDCYSSETIEKCLKLSREKLVALALLLGCDYCPQGVPGVGRENAVKFFETLEETNVLSKFKSWSLDDERSTCSKAESFVKSRALKTTNFPNDEIINEYLRPRNIPNDLTREKIVWHKPSLASLQVYLSKKLEWTTEYIIAKIIPLITLWILKSKNYSNATTAERIIRERVKDKIPVYEVQWRKLKADVWTEQQFYITLENQQLVNAVFPGLVEEFRASKIENESKKKKGKCKTRPDRLKLVQTENDDADNSLILFENDIVSENNFLDDIVELENEKENVEIDKLTSRLQHVAVLAEKNEECDTGKFVESTSNVNKTVSNVSDNSPLPLAKRLQLLSSCKSSLLWDK